MKEKWDKLIEDCKEHLKAKVDVRFTDFIYNKLEEFYNGNERYYHNLDHIKTLLEFLEWDFGDQLKQIHKSSKTIVEIAIWFHDVIYIPGYTENEIASANFCKIFTSSMKLSKWYDIDGLIIDTDHKFIPLTLGLSNIICDLDLRELADEKRYFEIANLVRKEFSHLSIEEWRKGRKEFLKSFLAKDRIYHTKMYYDRYEKLARENIEKELIRKFNGRN